MVEFEQDVKKLTDAIRKSGQTISAVYGVPRGGVPLAVALSHELGVPLDGWEEGGSLLCSRRVPHPFELLVVDDVVDSGRTRARFNYQQPFACLHDKLGTIAWAAHHDVPREWIHYWWEPKYEVDVEDAVVRQIEYIGEDPGREGLAETPARVVRAWGELFAGYKQRPATILKTFEDGACDEMVLLKDIELYSTCEHHLLPFVGKAHIAYIPDGRVVGVSKLARLLEVYARRLQIQERLGQQVTTALMEHIKPKGAACIIEAQHLCMQARGIQKQGSVMTTSSLRGVFLEKPEARAELMRLIG